MARPCALDEVVLPVPNRRSLKTLINATAIRSPDGDVQWPVVALKDLAPLKELCETTSVEHGRSTL